MMDPVWLFEGRRFVPTLLLDSPASLLFARRRKV